MRSTPGRRRRLDGASDGKHLLPPAGGWLSPVRCRQEWSGSAQSLLEDGGLPALSSCAGPRVQGSLSCWEEAAVITGPPSQPPLSLLTPQRPVSTCRPTRAATSFPSRLGKGPCPQSVTLHVNDGYLGRVCGSQVPGTSDPEQEKKGRKVLKKGMLFCFSLIRSIFDVNVSSSSARLQAPRSQSP